MAKRTTDTPSLADAAWLRQPETGAVLAVLEAAGHGARVVGGAVRNALLGVPVKDIDIATTAEPSETMRLMEKAGLKAVPTGILHGTVTVIVRHIPFEVTTLRRDVETFGRHARVLFTDDWAEDAKRRDFTINALYADARGVVHDPVGTGCADLASRRVRFIGKAEDRIREDYLRILRFFRFTAEYAEGRADPDGLRACQSLKEGLRRLSGERIHQEMLRLLVAPAAIPVLEVMHETGILEETLLAGTEPSLAARMAAIEEKMDLDADAMRRLAALAITSPGGALRLRERLRLSNAEYDRLASMAVLAGQTGYGRPEVAARAQLYRHGREVFLDAALYDWARSGEAPDENARVEHARLPQRWSPPVLPVRGADVIALGVPAGPKVGQVMSAFEDWWIAAGFPSDASLIAAELSRLAVVTKS